MIDEQHMFQALTSIVQSKEILNLLKTLIIETDEGEYLLFGVYTIKKVDDLYDVYIGSEKKNTFNTLKAAVTWSTLDSKNNILLANRVNSLDKKISSADFSIDLYKKLYKKSKDVEMKVVYLNKLQQETIKKKKLSRELDLHVRKTQDWQMKKFQEQTSK